MRTSNSASGVMRTRTRRPLGFGSGPLAAAVDAADERAQVAHGIARDAAAGAVVAQGAQHPRHRLQGRAQQRVPALGRDDRVEHERLDAVGVGRRVVQRDLVP